MSTLQYSSSQSSPTISTPPQSQLYSPSQIMSSLQPPTSQPVKMSSNTFVHKLYNMVVDKQYQHLIAWNYTGSSFIVCNIMEFSRDVLPKHFKHNNFSSFVRQLNMYGFHKVNKSPRGHRTLAENQIWEFSHPKFLRGRSDLLDDIKRKAMESETLRRETGDLHAHIAMLQVAQNDLVQQIRQLHENFAEVVRDLAETKKKQTDQQDMMKNMFAHLSNQGPPSRSPHGQSPNRIMNIQLPTSPYIGGTIMANQVGPLSPNSFSSFNAAINTPLPPSPSPGSPMAHLSDDEMDGSFYCASPGSNGGSDDIIFNPNQM
ncbi:10452_t:CDS:2 [Diversispora eburnea]|uniref:10452_t:CDS:1 n=1 Tax=Diversispora eburnea TaxID=1213867 RepID=A0A9N9B5Y1_9GLOM|nr:10452_t:CDS:2 [Diversispora eburnea]